MAFSTSFSFDGVESQTHITSNGDITSYTATSINPNSKEIITSYTATSINHGAEEVSFQSHTFVSDPTRSFSDPFGHQPVSYTPLCALTDPSGHWDHHRQPCASQSEPETTEGKLLPLVKEILTNGWNKLSSIAKKIVEIVKAENITKGLESLLSAIFRLVGMEAPDELAGKIASKLEGVCTKLAPILKKACGVYGDVVAVIGCLFAIGIYVLDVYRAYKNWKRMPNNSKREFGCYVVAKTKGLLDSCGGTIASTLLNAIVGWFIGSWFGDWAEQGVSIVLSVAGFIIKKGIEWATGKTYEQIVSDMEKETDRESSSSTISQGHTPGIVHFYSIDTVCVEYEDDSLYYCYYSTTIP